MRGILSKCQNGAYMEWVEAIFGNCIAGTDWWKLSVSLEPSLPLEASLSLKASVWLELSLRRGWNIWKVQWGWKLHCLWKFHWGWRGWRPGDSERLEASVTFTEVARFSEVGSFVGLHPSVMLELWKSVSQNAEQSRFAPTVQLCGLFGFEY